MWQTYSYSVETLQILVHTKKYGKSKPTEKQKYRFNSCVQPKAKTNKSGRGGKNTSYLSCFPPVVHTSVVYPLRVSGAKLRVLMLMRLYRLGWYWCGELGSTLEKLLSAAMVSIFTQPSLLSFSPLEGCAYTGAGKKELPTITWRTKRGQYVALLQSHTLSSVKIGGGGGGGADQTRPSFLCFHLQ